MPQLAFHEVVSSNADFQRLGAVAYLRAQQLAPAVQAVVQESAARLAVIAVRKDSPITHLSQFAGRAFAGCDENTTIGQWAKFHLVRAGVRQSDLSLYQSFDDVPAWTEGHQSVREPISSPVGAERVRQGSLFLPEDFLEFTALVRKLSTGSDLISQWLWSGFPEPTRRELTNAAVNVHRRHVLLADALNEVLRGPACYDPQRFASVTLSAETRAWLSRPPQADDQLGLHRLLLEDTFPEIARRQQFDGVPIHLLNFERWKDDRLGLRALVTFRSTPNVYVARAGLDPKIVAAFQHAMLSTRDADLIRQLPLRPRTLGFHMPDQAGLQALRAALDKEVREFDGPSPAPTAAHPLESPASARPPTWNRGSQ